MSASLQIISTALFKLRSLTLWYSEPRLVTSSDANFESGNSFANALAKVVLPVPGGPYIKTDFVGLPPLFLRTVGFSTLFLKLAVNFFKLSGSAKSSSFEDLPKSDQISFNSLVFLPIPLPFLSITKTEAIMAKRAPA